jgi:cobalt-precorrin-5B (C1)-methyltransferase
MVRKPGSALKRGWTTGACAAAASKAAYTALLSRTFPDPVTITLPGGETPAFALAREVLAGDRASAGIVKDAGDDPDVTHGALIVATVRKGAAGSGVVFRAGEGVGTVTKPGLPLAPGEPAINPRPREMIRQAIAEAARAHGGTGDVDIEIAVPGGEAIARKTWNPRLGIVGGISILGTTGVVIPYSCSAWIHSIHRGVDVARAAGLRHVAGSTGSTSERAVQSLLKLPETALLDMGDFAGGLLKYLRRHPLPHLTLAGGFGKIAKLAQGHLDLHSGRGQVDRDWLADHMRELGADDGIVAKARAANSALEVLELARAAGCPLGDLVAARARVVALGVLEGAPIAVDVMIFDRNGSLAGKSDG